MWEPEGVSVALCRVWDKKTDGIDSLNSYWINQDGVYKYYEVILVE